MSAKLPEILDDLSETTAQILKAKGIAENDAREIGFVIAETIGGHWGGQMIYIPMCKSYSIERRDAEIFRKFNGSNHAELSAEFKLSMQHIYRIIKRVNKNLACQK